MGMIFSEKIGSANGNILKMLVGQPYPKLSQESSRKYFNHIPNIQELNHFPIDLFRNYIQSEAKDVIPCAARNLHLIIMLQLHVQDNFVRC